MEFLVSSFDALQHLDGGLFVGRSDLDGFKVFREPVSVCPQLGEVSGRGCADALNLARYDRSLQQFGDVNRSYRGNSARPVMHPVQKEDFSILCRGYQGTIQSLLPRTILF